MCSEGLTLRNKAWLHCGACLFLLLSNGCTTTGDPTRDTIFFNRRKADERVRLKENELEQENLALGNARSETDAAQEQIIAQKRRIADLTKTCAQLEAALSALDRSLQSGNAVHREEVRLLENQLRSTMQAIERQHAEASLLQSGYLIEIDALKARIDASHARLELILQPRPR